MNNITHFIKPHNISPTKYRSTFLNNFSSDIIDGDVYEFGVFSGLSIVDILNGLKSINIRPNKVWGFDSFCGLPKSSMNEFVPFPEWKQGEFSSCAYLDINDPNKASDIIKQHIIDKTDYHNIEMIVGFFEDSLKPNDSYKPASIIDIDVDIYSSTITALSFMFEQKLVVPGTIIIYDDWKGETYGEGLAHIEIMKKYNIGCRHLYGDGERMYIVEKV